MKTREEIENRVRLAFTYFQKGHSMEAVINLLANDIEEALSQHDVINKEVDGCDLISHNADIIVFGYCGICNSNESKYI